MSLLTYGVLKGTVIGHLRNADDDHYQILVHAGQTLHRIASNVKSSAPKAPSTVLFLSTTTLPKTLTDGLTALPVGYKPLPSKPGGLALDYLRSGVVQTGSMKPVPPDVPGANNDLKDLLETAVVQAMKEEGSVIYALGAKWGPENGIPDQYFQFSPGNGIHDIHMNQGNSGKYKKDNGTFQDGALFIAYPGARWSAFFFAFQSQSFKTDDHGNPRIK
ncbi:MAG: YukJ family protein [Proteobacteria bacterium]|nr:YukJ family protein [Pseudomonadota bacterium]MBS0492373.1 YukJ family protein [Pseudomonadota bacterium]